MPYTPEHKQQTRKRIIGAAPAARRAPARSQKGLAGARLPDPAFAKFVIDAY